MKLFLSRLTLNRNASTSSLIPLLNPTNRSKAADVHHRLVWTLYSDGKERQRDFLWRFNGRDRFLTLSKREPGRSDLFYSIETKEFEPKLGKGDILRFVMRVNATRIRRIDGKSQRVDIVMDALHGLPPNQRVRQRDSIAQIVSGDWMKRQGLSNGFTTKFHSVDNYHTIEIDRDGSRFLRRKNSARLGILELSGIIEVTHPDLLLTAIGNGFGRAKAWGCGLMLIRRSL